MDARWVSQHLLCDSGFQVEFAHQIALHTGTLSADAYLTRSISNELQNATTRWGTLQELLEKLAGRTVGTWFYAGWIDQAVLHVGTIGAGGTELLNEFLAQIDDDQVDQGGDMIVVFFPSIDQWLFCIEASPDDCKFVVSIRTNSDARAQEARKALQLDEANAQ